MNIKKYIPQIYEFRIIQSTKAIIDVLVKSMDKIDIFKDRIENIKDDKYFIDYLYYEILYKGKKIKSKDIDYSINLYSIYTNKIKTMFNKYYGTKKIDEKKIATYYLISNCILEYLKLENELYSKFNYNIAVPTSLLDNTKNINIILSNLFFKELKTKEKNISKEEMEIIKSLNKIFSNKEKILKNIELFLADYLYRIIYTVKIEYFVQFNYIKKENEKILLNIDKDLKKLLFNIKDGP